MINITLSAPGKRKHGGRAATAMNSAFYVITRRSAFRREGLLLQRLRFRVFRRMFKGHGTKGAGGKRKEGAEVSVENFGFGSLRASTHAFMWTLGHVEPLAASRRPPTSPERRGKSKLEVLVC